MEVYSDRTCHPPARNAQPRSVRGRDIRCDLPSIALVSAGPAIVENSFEKILQDLRVVQTAFLLHRHLGEVRHEGAGEQANPVVCLFALRVYESDSRDAATRRGALEDEAGEVQGFQFTDPLLCEAVHRFGVVYSGVDRDEARRIEIADQAHGLARSSQADFHFRAHWDPFYVLAQGFDQNTVELVTPVVPNVLAEQTLADPDADRYGHVRQRAAAALGVSSADNHVGLNLSGWCRCRRRRRGGSEWDPGGAEGGTPESSGLRQGSRLSTSG